MWRQEMFTCECFSSPGHLSGTVELLHVGSGTLILNNDTEHVALIHFPPPVIFVMTAVISSLCFALAWRVLVLILHG